MELRRHKTDLDPRTWFLRVHDYGLGWLHMTRFYLISSTGFKENFLRFFGVNHESRVQGPNAHQ